MYTGIITLVVVFIIVSCFFKSEIFSERGIKFLLIVGVVAVVLTTTIVSVVRINRLDIKKDYKLYSLQGIVYRTDTIYHKVDTIKVGSKTIINDTIVNKSQHPNKLVMIRYKTLLKGNKDTTFTLLATDYNDGKEINYKNLVVRITSNKDSANTLVHITREYISDNWVAMILPSIDSWDEVYLTKEEYELACKVYPNLKKI